MRQEVQAYVTINQRFEESDEGDRQMGFGVVHCLKKITIKYTYNSSSGLSQ